MEGPGASSTLFSLNARERRLTSLVFLRTRRYCRSCIHFFRPSSRQSPNPSPSSAIRLNSTHSTYNIFQRPTPRAPRSPAPSSSPHPKHSSRSRPNSGSSYPRISRASSEDLQASCEGALQCRNASGKNAGRVGHYSLQALG